MSASEPATVDGASLPSNYSAFADEKLPKVRVYVDGEEIPVINEGCKTTTTTDGPLGINKLTEVYYPTEWMDENFDRHISAADPSADNFYDPVDVKYYSEEAGQYVTYHRGFVIGVGGGSKGSIERQIRIADVGQLLRYVPFDKTYEANTDITEVVGDILQTFNEFQHTFDAIDVTQIEGGITDNFEESRSANNPFDDIYINIFDPIGTATDSGFEEALIDSIKARALNALDWLGSTDHVFQGHKDTCKDAMDFVSKKVDGHFYFAPTSDDHRQISLVYSDEQKSDFNAQHTTSGTFEMPTVNTDITYSPKVIENNAIYEMQPINTIQLKGKPDRGVIQSTDTIGSIFDDQLDQEFPVATAQHSELVDKAGEMYRPPTTNSDATTVEVAEAEAKKELKNQLMGGNDGNILLKLFPYIHPHDSIHSKMACGDNIAEEFDPFDYSVNTVIHKVGYDDEIGQYFFNTKLSVNQIVRDDDIEIIESGMEDQESLND